MSNVARVDIINPHTSTPAPLSSMAAASSAFINPSSSSAVPHPTYVKGHWGRGGGGGREGLNELPSDHRHQAPPTMGGDFLSRGGVKNQEVEWEDDPPSGQPLSGVGAWDRQPGDTEASEIGIHLNDCLISPTVMYSGACACSLVPRLPNLFNVSACNIESWE